MTDRTAIPESSNNYGQVKPAGQGAFSVVEVGQVKLTGHTSQLVLYADPPFA